MASLRDMVSEYPHLCVDEYMKRCLEIRLIQAIVKV